VHGPAPEGSAEGENHWYPCRRISDVGEVRCLRRAKSILKDSTHPATACSSCCLLGRDIEVSAAAPPDCRATA